MIRLLSGDARDVLPTLPAESVQCCITSPPYYGLRDYGTALWDGGDAACDHVRIAWQRQSFDGSNGAAGKNCQGWKGGERNQLERFRDTCGKCGAVRVDRQIGLEATPDEYLATMVGVFREVRRVLRRDGTCWVNMGDSYAGATTARERYQTTSWCINAHGDASSQRGGNRNGMGAVAGAKPKDLLLMPARLALALQQDGWWVRSDIIWAKPNPMPESCTDRPTSAHEHVFLLTRSSRYFYDADAVRSPLADKTFTTFGTKHRSQGNDAGGNVKSDNWGSSLDERKPKLNGAGEIAGAACRNVWTIATHAYPEAHFATFPPELAERCIKAGTSERGCCAACGKPWQRIVEREIAPAEVFARRNAPSDGFVHAGASVNGEMRQMGSKLTAWRNEHPSTTTGWSPGCQCNAEVVPCTVLDPFIGAGTTALVADRLQRDVIGIDLNVDYTRMAMDRCIADAPLFTSFPPAEPPEDERMADLFTDMAAD